MKLTKSDLKSIVKECLVEILSEGIGATTSKTPIQESSKTLINKTQQKIQTKRRESPALHQAILQESGGNPIMAEILADTAAKSLPTMLENDRSGAPTKLGPVGIVENIVASKDPEEIFGEEAASKWANLAFANSPNK
jgi:hypothetical protein